VSLRIEALRALEILDSRGNPTVAVRAELTGGTRAWAQVPSGASTGRHEAVELRDAESRRYGGKGVRRAVRNVNEILAPALRGLPAEDQAGLDAKLIELDGTPDKSQLGANALLGVSCAVARAVSMARREPLWKTLAGGGEARFPLPMVNIISGGHHAGHNIEFQDFLIIPHGFETFHAALEATVQVHRAVREEIIGAGYALTGVADEGGWGPWVESNVRALELLSGAIVRAGFEPRAQVSIALDVAASHFHKEGRYHLRTEDRELDSAGMAALLEDWLERFAVVSIEDGLAEDDWDGWRLLTRRLGSKAQLVGDDFFTTNPERLRRGVRDGCANAVLVKMNQIGTLSETFEVARMARAAGYNAVISARSGETEDSFLADLAVASGAGQIKIGSITRSERLAKYNRLLELEEKSGLAYPGGPFRLPEVTSR
jgi:enolase